jgi:Sulfotransferase family
MAPIFIVGCPRSGTTLLRNLLRSHPHLSFPSETHFIPQLYAAYGDPVNEREARRLTKALLRLRWVRRWNCDFDESKLVARGSYAGIIDELFQTWLRKEGKPRWGDKTPQYVLHLRTLAAIFPEARFIHIFRDGRDVARSWLLAPHGPENWFMAASEWRRLVRAGRQAGVDLPTGMYMEVRYEALLTDLETTLRRICEFVDEPFDPAILSQSVMPNEMRVRRVPGFRPFSRGYNGQQVIVRDNVNKWKSNLTLKQRVLFESVAGDLLRELGYETEGHERQIPAYAQWAWRVHSQVMETLVKLNTQTLRDWVPTVAQMSAARIHKRLRATGADSRSETVRR